MQLTIIYHLYNNSTNIKKSLKSILDQEDKDFSIIFLLDQANEDVRKYLKEINFLKNLKNFKIISISKNLGHAYTFNFALPYVKTPYVYFASSSTTLKPNFVAEFNKHVKKDSDYDMVLFDVHHVDTKTLDFALANMNIKKNLNMYFQNSYTNKIFSVSFLNKNKINFTNFRHYVYLYLYDAFSKMKTYYVIDNVLLDLYCSDNKNYNSYDLVDQFSILLGKYGQDEFYTKNKEHIKYVIIRLVLFSFLLEMWERTSCNKKYLLNAIEYTSRWLKKYIPNWSKNEVLLSNSNKDSKKVINYLKSFTFKPKTIIKNIIQLTKEM